MASINTASDWWNEIEDNKKELLELINKYHPGNLVLDPHNMEITAKAAEAVCAHYRKEIRDSWKDGDPAELFAMYVLTKDVRAYNILSSTWFGMPESAAIRSERGFHSLCDLCSESWVLDPQGE